MFHYLVECHELRELKALEKQLIQMLALQVCGKKYLNTLVLEKLKLCLPKSFSNSKSYPIHLDRYLYACNEVTTLLLTVLGLKMVQCV